MAELPFDLKHLQPLGGSARSGMTDATDPLDNAKAAWIYSSETSPAGVSVAGFFNPVRDLLNPNDVIYIGGGSKNLRWTSVLAAPRSPSTANVTISTKDQDAA